MNYDLLLQAAFGFMGVICGTLVSWGYMKARVTGLYEWKSEHTSDHHRIDRTLAQHGEKIAVLEATRGKSAGV